MQNENINLLHNSQSCQTSVSRSVLSLTEARFRQFMSDFPNGSESYVDGKKTILYTFHRNIDNKFNLSYHLKFHQKNIQFNFWFEKICYLNSNESVTISFFNGNEPKEIFRLKNILSTSNLEVLKQKVKDIFLEYQ